MRELSPEIKLQELVLSKLRLGVRQWISPYVMRHATASQELEFITERMMLMLDSHVWEQKASQTHEFVEERFPSWRHQLLAALPEHSFRRRFLERWWDMVGESLGQRITHTIVVDAHRAFPECSMDFPPEVGQHVVFHTVHHAEYPEDLR